MLMPRNKLVVRLLLMAWVLVVVWQGFEHRRVVSQARAEVIQRSRDITSTMGLVIRSQRRFGGIVSRPRLESALKELVKSEKLKSVALFNATGDVVASAGEPTDLTTKGMRQNSEQWDKHSVTVINLVDLGASLQPDGSNSPPTIVVSEGEPGGRREDGQRFPPPFMRDREGQGTNIAEFGPPPGGSNEPPTDLTQTNRPPRMRPGFRRPPWMNEEEYKALIEEKGLHGLAMVLPTDAFQEASTRDLWLRVIIVVFAGLSVGGISLAWKNLTRSSEFQMRLVRTSEMNTHLREMNIAAAGLAHETRNPLNIIRGLAQLIAKDAGTPDGIRQQSARIVDEVDQVTSQLNEFINYSKPRELRRTPVNLGLVAGEVARALKSDLEDKAIKLDLALENLMVNADQQLLRQVLFNLLINAIQAVPHGGEIQIAARRTQAREASLEVRDSGPGVPAAQRKEIFRPYYTAREHGTGLGLAVVKQIVMLHGWEIECLENQPSGAVFRVSRMETAAANGL